MKTHEEWIVVVKQRFDDRWRNARMWYPEAKSINDRYCKTEEEAQKVLANAYKLWNGEKAYNVDGTRSEVTSVIEGLGSISFISDKKIDHDMEIVAHKIKKRIVTDWETVEES